MATANAEGATERPQFDARPQDGGQAPRRTPSSLLARGYEAEDAEARDAVKAISTKGLKPISEFKRFAILTAASFGMVLASTSYAFNLFSGQLQATYKYKFRDMSNINTVGMVFAYFLLPYGTIYDFFGPLPIGIIAASYFTIGALLMGLTFQGVLAGSVARFCVYNAFLSLGSQLFDLASVVTVMSIFPTRKGWVIAILKTLMGLGQAVLGSIKIGLFPTVAADYFYFLIALVVVAGSAVMAIVRLPKYHLTYWQQTHLTEEQKAKRMVRRAVYLTQEPPMWRFYYGIAIILILVVYLPMTTALLAFTKLPPKASMVFSIVAVIMTCGLLFLMVPFPYLDRLTTKKSRDAEEEEAAANASSSEPTHGHERFDEDVSHSTRELQLAEGARVIDDLPAEPKKRREIKTDVDYIAPQYQTTFLQSCCTLKFWCIFWTMFCGLGCEFVIIFNARYIYAALDGAPVDDTVATLLTVLNGAGSALGRLGMSVFEAWTASRPPEKRVPITIAFFVPTSVIIASVILFLTLPGRSLLFAYAIAAIGNGFAASITILIIRTLYAKDPAKHYNFGINALVPAAVLINRLLFGEWLAVQTERIGSGGRCLKKACVLFPMVFMLGLNVTALFTNTYVHFSYRRFCNKVLVERRRIKGEASADANGSPTAIAMDGAEKHHMAAAQGEIYDGLGDSGSNSSSAPHARAN